MMKIFGSENTSGHLSRTSTQTHTWGHQKIDSKASHHKPSPNKASMVQALQDFQVKLPRCFPCRYQLLLHFRCYVKMRQLRCMVKQLGDWKLGSLGIDSGVLWIPKKKHYECLEETCKYVNVNPIRLQLWIVYIYICLHCNCKWFISFFYEEKHIQMPTSFVVLLKGPNPPQKRLPALLCLEDPSILSSRKTRKPVA